MTRSVLDGLRAVDLTTGPAGAQASTVLADFGADVISVDRPGGDPFAHHAAAPFWRRGKQIVEIDLLSSSGRADALALIAHADVVITAGPVSRWTQLGLDAATLRAAHPRLVHCSITGFGASGPDAELPGFEGLVAARAGRMAAFEGQIDAGRPVYAAVQVATHLASQGAVQGIVAGLMQAERTGHGASVETSLLQALMSFDLVDMLARQLHDRDKRTYTPLRLAQTMPTLNYHPLRAADGTWIQCGNLLEHLFLSFLDAIDLLGELLVDERFQQPPAAWTPDAIEEARDRILTRMQERTADEWIELFDANGNVAAEPIITTQQALDHRDIVPLLINVDDPHVGPTVQIGPIAALSKTPASPSPARPVASVAAVLQSARCDGDSTVERVAQSTPQSSEGRPLDGITILDLSTIIAGPLAMVMLADLGARVIKVEPLSGDPFRQMLIEGRMAVKTNAGKESICIDLKTSTGQAILHRLAASADAVVHNFRGDVPRRLGCDPDTLWSHNPDLICASVSGYGAHGPSALRPATHPVMGASTGGVAWQAGDALTAPCSTLDDVREAARQIMVANEANPDPNTSAAAASAVLLALLARERHADVRGQVVRIDMQTANAWANGDDFLRYPSKPARAEVDPERLGLSATYRLYATADGWVFLAAPDDRRFAELCAAAGWTFGDDPRFRTATERARHDAELATLLEEALATRTADSWQSTLTAAGVGCVRADGIDVGTFWAHDPQVVANGWSPPVAHERFGILRRWGQLATVDGTNPNLCAAPLAGQHTDALLAEAGFSADEITRLRSEGVVGSE